MSELSVWRRVLLLFLVFFGGFANLAVEIIAPSGLGFLLAGEIDWLAFRWDIS